MTSRSWRRSKRRRCSGWPKARGVLDLGLDSAGIAGAPLEIVSSHAGHLWDVLCRAYTRLGLDHAGGSDEVFRDLVLARIIEPTSKQGSLREIRGSKTASELQ